MMSLENGVGVRLIKLSWAASCNDILGLVALKKNAVLRQSSFPGPAQVDWRGSGRTLICQFVLVWLGLNQHT